MSSWPDHTAPLLQDRPVSEFVADAEPVERVRRAAGPDTTAATLRELALDPEIIVRAAVAMNVRCDPDVDSILAADGDERVRALLGGRIARLLPGLGAAERSGEATHVHATLTMLATDQATRVRAAIAEAVAAMDVAPRSLVLHLARDLAAEVSDQVVRLSPVLKDDDLMALLATRSAPHTAKSIANRRTLSVVVTDALVHRADAPTIHALLSNRSACIRETTLDALVGRAPSHVDWHAPLVRRPSLSAHAVEALTGFIAADLLLVLSTRDDLEPAKLEVVHRRLASMTDDGDEALLSAARQRQADGTLTEATLQDAVVSADHRALLAMLAVKSGVTLPMVDRVLELRGAKAVVSLVWRAGFSMGLAVDIQTAISHFSPDTIIHPTSDGAFPLSDDEMDWQIELMGAPFIAHA